MLPWKNIKLTALSAIFSLVTLLSSANRAHAVAVVDSTMSVSMSITDIRYLGDGSPAYSDVSVSSDVFEDNFGSGSGDYSYDSVFYDQFGFFGSYSLDYTSNAYLVASSAPDSVAFGGSDVSNFIVIGNSGYDDIVVSVEVLWQSDFSVSVDDPLTEFAYSSASIAIFDSFGERVDNIYTDSDGSSDGNGILERSYFTNVIVPFGGFESIGFSVDEYHEASSLTPVPEPSTYAAILGGLGLLIVLLRRNGRSTL